MNLLMLTRKVDRDDSNAGFIYFFVEAIAKQLAGELRVICLEKGNISGLPKNVTIYVLGKGIFLRFLKAQFFILTLIRGVDGVFTHMMPEYAILVGPWCRLLKKKLVHWYMHKAVKMNLKIANWFVDEYVTASELSFRLPTKKPVHYTGHLIDTDKFTTPACPPENTKIKILSVSRISPSKDIETIINSIELLNQKEIRLDIIGGPGLKEQIVYFDEMKNLVTEKKLSHIIHFLGPIAYTEIVPYYQQADIFINLGHTGALDKVTLEAMACGSLPLSCNEAFEHILKDKNLMVGKKDASDLADKIKYLINLSASRKESLKQELRQYVVENHSIQNTVNKIVSLFSNNLFD